MGAEAESHLRPLRPEDFEAVVEIDRRLTGRTRRVFFQKRLEAALADGGGFIAVASEDAEGRLIGFSIARVQSGEFGDDRHVAVIDVIAVDPDSRKHGQGTLLLEEITRYARKRGIDELRTQVDWGEGGLIEFFGASGFVLAPSQVLERATARNL
ncbi:MAG: GNAT family N-acetyltransferase [Rhodospirillales bacterium]|nr:GNAT family N-acetyltransferase [Rhodospirillales bacterium]MDH3790181.1 GNAT family N-acetyltransferase [Rhodospirillales bacterium]MDH3909784.1 GNAT family N-acetyltransferase [Rhodospirillales bacterium]MDH3920468.1 GNAT family N-acetyltransferase [Rhodospirillales bacterium]MDH3966295.1 GNAT family N-acetyltransferase [Rhodospirillales bacterium]